MSFEAYKVAVTLTLQDEVTGKIKTLSGEFGQLDKKAKGINATLDVLSAHLRKIQDIGQGLFFKGAAGIGLMGYIVKPAEEYAHQLNIMNMQGMKHKQIAEAIAAAWKTTQSVVTSTATGNLKTILDLRTVFGNVNEAIEYLPEIARIQAILRSSSNLGVRDNADELGFALAKSLDIRGAALNPQMFNTQAEMMAKVITMTQGRITPTDYQMLFKYGRQSISGLSNQFLYQELPTFMMEMKTKGGSGGHGGFGTSLAAGYRFFVQGIMSKVSLAHMAALGLIPSGSQMVRTTTTGSMLVGGVKDAALFQSDPFQWVQQVLLPAIHKKYGNNLNNNQLSLIVTSLMKGSSQTAQFEILKFITQAQQVYRDQRLIRMAANPMTAYQMALSNDPTTVNAAFAAQWNNLRTALGMTVIPVLLPLMMRLTQILSHWALEIRRYPNLFKMLSVGFGMLAISMTGIGALMWGGGAAGNGIIGAFKVFKFALEGIAAVVGVAGAEFVALGAFIYGLVKLIENLKPTMQALEWLFSHFHMPTLHQIGHDFVDDFFYAGQERPPIIHNNIHLDGKQIAHVVTQHQAAVASQQPSHGSTTNPHISLLAPMMNTF